MLTNIAQWTAIVTPIAGLILAATRIVITLTRQPPVDPYLEKLFEVEEELNKERVEKEKCERESERLRNKNEDLRDLNKELKGLLKQE